MDWKMIDLTHFVGEKKGYTALLRTGGNIGNYWEIKKGDDIIDVCFRHPPQKGELNSKAQIERVINGLLKTDTENLARCL